MSEEEFKICLQQESFYGIISCIITFVLGVVMLKVYSFDPLDRNLIINEQATYLTSKYTDIRKICSVPRFLEEVDEQFQREQEIRRGTNKTSFMSDKLRFAELSSNRELNTRNHQQEILRIER